LGEHYLQQDLHHPVLTKDQIWPAGLMCIYEDYFLGASVLAGALASLLGSALAGAAAGLLAAGAAAAGLASSFLAGAAGA
jgi:hypothetical protein